MPEVAKLLDEYAASDPRIKVMRRDENGHISAASNSALALATGGGWPPWTTTTSWPSMRWRWWHWRWRTTPMPAIVYSDEDKIDESGRRRDPFFKPDFDPFCSSGQNFVSHLCVFRRDLVDRWVVTARGTRAARTGTSPFGSRSSSGAQQVVHIPHVLYHWRAHASSTASLCRPSPTR